MTNLTVGSTQRHSKTAQRKRSGEERTFAVGVSDDAVAAVGALALPAAAVARLALLVAMLHPLAVLHLAVQLQRRRHRHPEVGVLRKEQSALLLQLTRGRKEE